MTEIEMRQAHAIISACKTISGNHVNILEQRRYELARDCAVGLMTSRWFDGTSEQAIDRGIEFADAFIEKYVKG